MRSTRWRIDRVDEEGVLHRARRVVLVEVQRVEVEPLVLELRTLGDLPAHRDEHVAHLLHEHGERMPGARPEPGRQRRDIQRLAREPRRSPRPRRARPRAPRAPAVTRARAWPTSLPAAARSSAAIDLRLALNRASGEASPTCAARAPRNSLTEVAAAIAAIAASAASVTAVSVMGVSGTRFEFSGLRASVVVISAALGRAGADRSRPRSRPRRAARRRERCAWPCTDPRASARCGGRRGARSRTAGG